MSLAKVDTQAALAAAHTVPDAHARCIALAWVARYAPSETVVLRIAREAARTADDAPQAYDSVTGAAWPVRALIERAHPREAAAIMRKAVDRSEQIAGPVRRMEALFLLAQAGWASGGDAWSGAIGHLVAAARTASSWKAPVVLRDVILMMAGTDRDFRPTLANMPEGKHRRQVQRCLEAKRFMTPRPFFW
jgi:hypothetical protein